MKKEANILSRKLLIIIAFFFLLTIIFALIFGQHGLIELLQTKEELQKMQQKVSILEAERDRLKAEVHYYLEQPLAVEEIARRDLWLMKKNEKVIVIVSDKKAKH